MSDADLVRKAVEAAGGQVELARLCGVSQPTVASWIARNRIPRWQRERLEVIATEKAS